MKKMNAPPAVWTEEIEKILDELFELYFPGVKTTEELYALTTPELDYLLKRKEKKNVRFNNSRKTQKR